MCLTIRERVGYFTVWTSKKYAHCAYLTEQEFSYCVIPSFPFALDKSKPQSYFSATFPASVLLNI